MEVLQEVIYTQNFDLLHRIADDMYIDECDKQTFIKRKYNDIHVVKMENIEKELPRLNNKFNLHYKIYENQNE